MHVAWSWRGANLSGAREWEVAAGSVDWKERRTRRVQQGWQGRVMGSSDGQQGDMDQQ